MDINLLIVEDDISQIKLLIDAIEIYNKKVNITNPIVLDQAITLGEGLEKLKSKTYDGAIVDLRLEKNDNVGLGNKILREIKSKQRFPVRVISGHLGDLDPELQMENYLFKCKNRGEEEFDTILSEFSDIYSTGILGILNNTGLIETNINNIFWKHISEILPEFIKYKASHTEWNGEKVLLRYISSHILEYLEISIDNNLEPFHILEFYIKPPIKDKLFTGDILKFKETGKYGIILTPVCDLATDSKRVNPKAEYITVVIIEEYEDIIKEKNSGDIKKLKSNNMDLKYHYLPETKQFKGGFINFQNILSIPILDLNNKTKYELECVISNSFRKEIISRFSNYFSRQGQPTFE